MLLMVAIGIGAYLLGSIPFGKIIAARQGIDIQKRGSGNIGFANVLRILGWKAAVPVLILDVSKGLLPTLLASTLFTIQTGFIIGAIAVLGHLFPLWLRFRGGKGVATSLGVLLGTTPLIGLIGFSVYVVSSLLFKKSSYASLAAGFAVSIAGSLLFPQYLWAYGLLLFIALVMLRKNLFGTVPNYDI